MAMELPPFNIEDFSKWKSGNAVIQVSFHPTLSNERSSLLKPFKP